MRLLIIAAALATTVTSLSFWEKAQGFLSGNNAANSSASISTPDLSSSEAILSGIKNSSFGQAVIGGIEYFNQQKNGNGSWKTAIGNSSAGNYYQQGVDFYNTIKNGSVSFIDTDAIQQTVGNSTLGEVVQTGIQFFQNLKNGTSPFFGDASAVVSKFVPFLANASTEATSEFYALLPKTGNMTIAEFETAVNSWAAKYGLADDVEAFNTRNKNATIAAEDHANAVVINLPNVLNNLKAVTGDKNQTVSEMHSKIISYVNSLDEDTRDIVFIFFRNFLPPQFKKSKCGDNGHFLSNLYEKASKFFGDNSTENRNYESGNGPNREAFWASFNGNNSNAQSDPITGFVPNFLNKNITSAVQGGAEFASIQILPAAPVGLSDPFYVMPANEIQVDLSVPESTQTTKKNKKQQKKTTKNKKKKTTTVTPLVVEGGVTLEVHAEIL